MARFYIETYGCSLNKADSQTIIALLKKAQFNQVENVEQADIIIINSCTVKSPTETKILRRLRELKKQKKPIVLAGCIPQAEPGRKDLQEFSQMGVFQIPNVVQIAEEALDGNIVVALAKEDYNRLDLPHYSQNKLVGIIPICQGCLGDPCSYCLVKKARGSLFSYDPRAILNRAQEAIQTGKRELWLTAQDTAAYGKDINNSLPQLLKLILKVEGNYWIRLGMGNPNHIKGFVNQLIEVFKDKHMFRFLHIPVQSGNNEVLKRMKRKYTVEEFIEIVDKFRRAVPNITIATDIIAGFPGETASQFKDSLKLVSRIKPNVLNISRYWPRPGTSAAKMEGYSGNLTKARSRVLTKEFDSVAFQENAKWLGWKGRVFIDEKGSFNSWQGRNLAYRPIVVNSNENLLGKIIKVKIFDITAHYLRAKQIV